jgi:hypothetical protein
MSAPPEAETEYSRGSAVLRGVQARRRRGSQPARPERSGASSAALAAVLLGALLVLVSQFTPLYDVHPLTSSTALRAVGTGANHAYAPVPLALLAVCLALAVLLSGSRLALLGVLVLGVATLGIALLGDLPGVHANGLVGSSASQYVEATSTASAGLYMETLGAVLLMIGGGVGLLMSAGRPAPARADP